MNWYLLQFLLCLLCCNSILFILNLVHKLIIKKNTFQHPNFFYRAVFQILECCHFLDTQQRNGCKNDQNSPVVLFLVGQLKEGTDINIKGICTSIGKYLCFLFVFCFVFLFSFLFFFLSFSFF